ncbi:MAG TPA: hypothetical protein VGP71_01290 [Burkholderiales bacterium]|jgi:hypothetical protein|nr:hypothetical protein [Burkholderiales bacterium]
MAGKLLLYFTAVGHSLYRWRGGTLHLEATFSPDDAGVAGFREYLKGREGALAQVVADLSGEDFHEDQIPYLRGAERQAVIERRLAHRYRDPRLATALSLGHAADERRNERLLLASFNDTQQLAAWLDVLEKARARLAGVYSTALLAPALAARLGMKSGPCFVMSANRAGLRQCFIEDGRLRFSRLGCITESGVGLTSVFVRTETERMLQYLGTLRALPRNGPPLRVLLIVPDEERAHFVRTLGRGAGLAFTTIGLAEASRKAGLPDAPDGTAAERLYLQLAGLQPPREQFLRGEGRRSFLAWRLQRSIVTAGAAGFVTCGAYAATLWLEQLAVRTQSEGVKVDTAQARDQLERIRARFPAAPTTIENLKATALEFRGLAARSASPEGALEHVSRALDRSPQIELDTLSWSAGTEPPQTLEISGRVNATQRSDYRAVTEQVQRFSALLSADPAWRIVGMRLPFDISPEGTLAGGTGGADSSDVPRFTISIARIPG